MRRMITLAFMMTMVVMMAHAQGALKKVYNESIDPMSQIDAGLQKAKTEGKFVICQLGDNGCQRWRRLAECDEKDTEVDPMVYHHVV